MQQVEALLAKIKANSHNKVQVEELVTQLEGLVSGNYLAKEVELRQVLMALLGPDHHIRELQYTRSLPDNPINVLVEQFNEQAKDL